MWKMARSKPCLSLASQVQTGFENHQLLPVVMLLTNSVHVSGLCIQVTLLKSHRNFSVNEKPKFSLVLCGVCVGVVCW